MTKLSDVIGRGLASARPAFGVAGRLYYSTDTAVLERDSGAAWETVEGNGAALTVQEADGAPLDAAVTILRFPNGSLTDNGTGDISVAFPASGAPTTAPYVTTAADGGLSAEKVIPYLADWNNRLQGGGFTWFDHFDDESLDGAYTAIGTPADGPAEDYYHGVLLISDASSSSDLGVRRAVALTANELAVVAKLAWTFNKADAYAGLVITDSSDTPLCTATFQRKTSDLELRTGPSGGTLVALPGYAWADEAYLLIQVSTTTYSVYVSKHGYHPWHLVHSFSQAGTIARLRLILNPQNHSYPSSVMFDFAGAYPATALTYIGNVP